MGTLKFRPIALSDIDWVDKYTSLYGEGSCQHSPVSMFSLSEKYGDEICEQEGILYVLRRNLCDDTYRVYMAPFGEDRGKGFKRILDDAKEAGRMVKFITLTENAAQELEAACPNMFDTQEERDLAEYIYSTKIMSTFSGSDLHERRREVHAFWNHYGQRAQVEKITPKDIPEILAFEQKWLEDNQTQYDMESLQREARMIGIQLPLFKELHLSGIVVRIDGRICGFSYGTRLNDRFYDAIIEKGDHEIQGIHRVLRQESVRQCALEFEYVNLEEDLGIEGLRAMKMHYHPAFMLSKYTATYRL